MENIREEIADQVVRDQAEQAIKSLSQGLKKELAANDAQKNPNRRVHTSILVVADDERFIALDGSAHRMAPLFKELFQRRPDLVGVARDVLNEMFRIADL